MWYKCKQCGEVTQDIGCTIYEGYPADVCYACDCIDSFDPCDEPEEEDENE